MMTKGGRLEMILVSLRKVKKMPEKMILVILMKDFKSQRRKLLGM